MGGCDIIFSLIPAFNYLKYLRPKLISHYGKISRERAQKGEKSRLRTANVLRHLQNDSIESLLRGPNEPKDGPVKKYLKQGGLRTQQSYGEMRECFEKYTTQIYNQGNYFLRLDEYLQQIDSFQSSGAIIKVSNILQVQNYCNYIEGVKKILQQHPNCEWASQYQDIEHGNQMFTGCYQQMKNQKDETYLIYEIST